MAKKKIEATKKSSDVQVTINWEELAQFIRSRRLIVKGKGETCTVVLPELCEDDLSALEDVREEIDVKIDKLEPEIVEDDDLDLGEDDDVETPDEETDEEFDDNEG